MQNSYDQIAEQWHASVRGQVYVERILGYVDLVLAGLRPGAQVLDLGCGSGYPIAKHIVGKGFRLLGVDQSARMLAIAQEVVPKGEFVQSNMIDVQLAGGFGAAIAWDSIFHVERKYHASVYRKLSKSLKPGGRVLLSAGGSGADCITSEMFGQKFSYSGHEPEDTRRMLEAEGFEIEVWEVDDPSSHGHLAIIASRTA